MKKGLGLGITTACPHCKHIAIKNANFSSPATFYMKCPHCGGNLFVKVEQEMSVEIAAVTLFLIALAKVIGTLFGTGAIATLFIK